MPSIIRACCLLAALVAGVVPARAAGLSVEQTTVKAGGRAYHVKVVRVPRDGYRVKVGLAQGRVGMTAPLAAIAQRYGAVAAINGCFFDAYTRAPIKSPWHHLITDGQLVHHGNTGTTLGFDAQGNYRMERLQIRITGTVGSEGGRQQNWYAYRVNFPLKSSGAMIYNRYWAGGRTPAQGRHVLVRDGVVQAIGTGARAIPADGYALLFAGGEAGLAGRFQVGQPVRVQVSYGSRDEAFWQGVQEGIGCGPRLLAQGAVVYNPTAEGFSSPKVLRISGARSAVGIRRDGTLLLVTTTATVRQLADVMKALGAYDAMNLDGGASSGLWVQGRYLTSPGRNLSNALLILKR
ncbi:MAG: phosphodiester glycosidase family protein [Armatimonadetes bacterium]|nr:phosphodiester glycosidase family protein [Armatimonadota bacterium]